MFELRYLVSGTGRRPFERWFLGLDRAAAAKVTVALAKLEAGNFSNAKPVGAGVSEFEIDWGPGYRVYFGTEGEALIVLLLGGTKKRQSDDIAAA